MAGLADLELLYYVSFQKIGAFSKPDRFWKPVGFFPELLSMYKLTNHFYKTPANRKRSPIFILSP